MENIDYYRHWAAKRPTDDNLFLRHREKVIMRIFDNLPKQKHFKVLDLGCGYGRFLLAIKKKYGDYVTLFGLDSSRAEIKQGKKLGLNLAYANVQERTQFKDNYFDLITAAEIIEHLLNPDAFLLECNRTLKIGGYLIISTPNLCAWFNRILLLFGSQPIFLEPSAKSKLIGAGFLKKFKKDSTPVGHIRIFTFNALRDLLEANGFRIIQKKGAIFDDGFPKAMWPIDKCFTIYPKLSSNLIIVAKKIGKPRI